MSSTFNLFLYIFFVFFVMPCVVLDIESIPVEFPFQPYPCQLLYLKNLVRALESGWNGLLESPTGTGKTLCLLCGALGWLRHKKKQMQHLVDADQGVKDLMHVPKVVYSSRTHAQLSQVVRELNKTSYALDMKVCILGSRDNMCLNEEVKNEQNSIIKNNMCRMKVSKRTCHYYNNLETRKELNRMERNVPIMDMEDLMSYGAKQKICPYFKSRNDMEKADIILLPYNYVLDPRTRKSNKIDLKGNIVIFDEAHNLEKICEESVSVSLRSVDVALCIREVKSTLAQIQEAEENFRQEMDKCEAGFGEAQVGVAEPEKDLDVNDVAHVLILLQNLEEEMDKIDLNGKDETCRSIQNLPGKIYPGEFMISLLTKSGIQDSMRDPISLLLDKMANFLTMRGAGLGSLAMNRGLHLQAFASFLSTVYHKDTVISTIDHKIRTDKTQKLFLSYITRDEAVSKKKGQLTVEATSQKPGIIVNYWCFSAGLGMQELCKRDVRSIIITSGTLAPIPQFAEDMKIPLPIRLENSHVVENSQVWCAILNRGPDNVQLNSSYQNRENECYVSSLGNAVVNISRVTPQGMLIFFASYSQMNNCVQKWKQAKIWDRIDNLKTIFVEPRDKKEFATVLSGFNSAIDSRKGAVFMAVCRGKLSEGMDFADKHGRCVLIAGIPYPPLMDARVCLKKDFLNNIQNDNKIQTQTGQSWYQLEAVRAVNQAMGRVIRHKDDFGAIVLADSRFQGWAMQQFPSWIRPVLNKYNKFGEMQQSLVHFFKGKGMSGPGRTGVRVSTNQGAFENSGCRKVSKRKCEEEWDCPSVCHPNTAEKADLYNHFQGGSSQEFSQMSESQFISGIACNSTFRDHTHGMERGGCRELSKKPELSVFDAMNAVSGYESKIEDVDELGALYTPPVTNKISTPPRKVNRIKLQVNASPKSLPPNTNPNPYYMAPIQFSREVKSYLPQCKHLQFMQKIKDYKFEKIGFDEIVEHFKGFLLPNRMDLLKGFHAFVKKEHKERYKRICEFMELRTDTTDV